MPNLHGAMKDFADVAELYKEVSVLVVDLARQRNTTMPKMTLAVAMTAFALIRHGSSSYEAEAEWGKVSALAKNVLEMLLKQQESSE